MRRLNILALSCGLILGCSGEEREDTNGQASLVTLGGSNSDSAPDTDSVDDDTGELKLDVGSAGSGGQAGGCGKVDFLFVIDNSFSMDEYQSRLVASFPGFVNAIRTALGQAQDYNIMVVDTDPAGPVDCASICPVAVGSNCVQGDTCTPYNPDIPLCTTTCLDFLECIPRPGGCSAPPPPEACDVMGAGIDFPRGSDASNMACAFTSGQRYIDTTETDLDSAFGCAARVGTNARGSAELPVGSMLAALDETTAAGACNAGFLREDAILVVTIITDEDDYSNDGTPGFPSNWVADLISAKNGDESAVVVLGLFGNEDDGCGEDSNRLGEFIDLLGDQGRIGSICSETYVPFFEEVVGLIDDTCDEFVPPG